MKCELSFIGHSGSNHSAFYLCRANSAGFYSTPCHAHVRLLKWCGLWMVMSVPCYRIILHWETGNTTKQICNSFCVACIFSANRRLTFSVMKCKHVQQGYEIQSKLELAVVILNSSKQTITKAVMKFQMKFKPENGFHSYPWKYNTQHRNIVYHLVSVRAANF